MKPNCLREKLILLISEKLIDAGLNKNTPQILAFSQFLRSNPVLLVDAILAGKQLTGEDMIKIIGDDYSSLYSNSTSEK